MYCVYTLTKWPPSEAFLLPFRGIKIVHMIVRIDRHMYKDAGSNRPWAGLDLGHTYVLGHVTSACNTNIEVWP